MVRYHPKIAALQYLSYVTECLHLLEGVKFECLIIPASNGLQNVRISRNPGGKRPVGFRVSAARKRTFVQLEQPGAHTLPFER